MSHANAILTPAGRLRLAKCVVDDGWPLRRAADRFDVSVMTAKRWADRYRVGGKAAMVDRSSRPGRCAHQLPLRVEHRIVGMRVSSRLGPVRIAYRLGLNPSTVGNVLARYGCPKLSFTDPATGARIKTSRRTVHRYEHAEPGDMIHVNIKKLGQIPDCGGHKVHGRGAGVKIKKSSKPGYAFIHNAVDDRSRLAYCEILIDERKDTAAGFWLCANAYFNDCGIVAKRVLTDNGSCYRSHAFNDALGEDIKHKRTRPYRPQTNGKAERFKRTMLEEWAYAQPYGSETERVEAFTGWLHGYNHHRGQGQNPSQPRYQPLRSIHLDSEPVHAVSILNCFCGGGSLGCRIGRTAEYERRWGHYRQSGADSPVRE